MIEVSKRKHATSRVFSDEDLRREVESGGNQTEIAARLGVTQSTVSRRMKKLVRSCRVVKHADELVQANIVLMAVAALPVKARERVLQYAMAWANDPANKPATEGNADAGSDPV